MFRHIIFEIKKRSRKFVRNKFLQYCEDGKLNKVKIFYWFAYHNKSWIIHAVMFASSKGRLDVIKWLHKKNCDIHCVDLVAVIWASIYRQMNVVQWLCEHSHDVTACHKHAIKWAAFYGDLNMVMWLHEHGADITAKNNSAIQFAAKHGNIDVVKYIASKL